MVSAEGILFPVLRQAFSVACNKNRTPLMINDLNLSLRTEILEIALNVEQIVNSILLIYLNIENEERKAITNKSGNLSFKNKIDLLYDLEIFVKEEHQQFLLLMEYRNQFLHNIDCNSFAAAILFLGKDKEKRLLKFEEQPKNNNVELSCNISFKNLYQSCIKIAENKFTARRLLIEDKAKLFENINKDRIYIINYFFDLIQKLFEMYEPTDLDTPEVIEIKTQIFQTIGQEVEQLNKTNEYEFLQSHIRNSITKEKLKFYFQQK